jgi:serine/threonine protein kinase/tetratricopeptide (TPR) repeat protein
MTPRIGGRRLMWASGQVILNEYTIVRELGSGGMATVYLARQVDRGGLLAIKVPHRHMISAPEERITFANEVQLWVSLPPHPHIVQCHFIREVDDIPVVFAEYVPSGTLESWAQRGRIRGPAHALDLGIQLAEALSVAQQMGLVHRDLKPANCLMDASGLLKVSDFGLAAAQAKVIQRRAEQGTEPVCGHRFSEGTEAYCSPEQYDGRPVDSRTDIWSFGVSLFELLTLQRPRLGPAAPRAIELYRRKHPDSGVPEAIWEFLLGILEPDVVQRPDCFSDVGEQMRKLYREMTGEAYPRQFPSRPEPAGGTPAAGSDRQRAMALLADALRRAGRDPAEADRLALSSLGGPRSREAELHATLAILGEAARIGRELISAGRTESRVLALAQTLNLTAQTQRMLGDPAAAAAAFSELIEQLQSVLGRSRSQAITVALAEAACNRAVCQRESGNLAHAVADYDHAIDEFSRVGLSRLPPTLRNEVANLHQNRAMALLKARRLAEALCSADQAIEIRQSLVDQRSDDQFAVDLAASYLSRGVLHRNLGNLKAASDDYACAIRLCGRCNARGQFAAKDDVLYTVFLNRSALHLATRYYTAAIADADHAQRILSRLIEASASLDRLLNLSYVLNNRSEARKLTGDLDGALRDLDRCIEIRQQLVERRGMIHLANELARAHYSKTLYLMVRNDFSSARSVVEQATLALESHMRRTGRGDLLTEHARLRVLRGVARYRTGASKQGVDDISGGIEEFCDLMDSGSADVVDGLVQALWFRVMLYLDVPFDPSQLRIAQRRWLQKARAKRDDPRREELLRAVRSPLLRLRDITRQSGQLSDYVKPRLRELEAALAQLEPRASRRPDVRSIIQTILEDRQQQT